jgi:hypothetical protein
MTKTNRTKGGANFVTAARAEHRRDSPSDSHQDSAFSILSAGAGNTRRMALMIKQRLLQDRSHPLKTPIRAGGIPDSRDVTLFRFDVISGQQKSEQVQRLQII